MEFNATLTKNTERKNLFLTQKICAPEIAQIFTHFYTMKKVNNSLLWAIVGLFALAYNPVVNAQDDLYFDPATDAPASAPAAAYTEEYDENNNVTRRYEGDDDGYYDDDDDYAYEYSSRIRRFQRRSVVVDYYDPFFVDLYNYDPFYSPGTSIYVYNYNDYWSYRRWQRWNRWNSWNTGWGGGYGAGWNSWGWNSMYAFNSPWYNPWVVNNYYYDPYWTCNGYNPYYQNHYYGNGWGNNHYYYNNDNNGGGGYAPKTYTGPRRNGSSVNPGYARIPDSNGRLSTSQTNVPMLERTATRPGRTAGDIETGRTKTASDRSVTPNSGGRRPEGSTAEPARTPKSETPAGRGVETKPVPRGEEGYKPRRTETTKPQRTETPAPRNEEGYKPRRSEETPAARPQRTETPSRKNNEGGNIRPRRTESTTPTRTEESRPARRTEERSMDRPSRSGNNGSGSSSQESRPSRSSDSGSSTRSSSGSSTRSNDSGSSRSSGGSGSKSSGSGRGGRN